MSLVAQRYLKKIDSSNVQKTSYYNVNKSSHDLFSPTSRSEFSPDESSLSLAFDNQNITKNPEQSLWRDKYFFESSNKAELKSFECEQPLYSIQNQSISESAYGSLSPSYYNTAEESTERNNELPDDTGLLFKSPVIKKRKIEDSFLDETVVSDFKNDSMCTEVLFGNDTISSVFMEKMKNKLRRESQSISNDYLVKEESDNDNTLLSSFKSSLKNSLNSITFNTMLDHSSELKILEPMYEIPKKEVENTIDISILNESVQCIDDTIGSQNNQIDAIENSVMMDEKMNLNSSYKTRKIFNSNCHLIEEFYKVKTSQNWNLSIENLPEMMEPSLEYIEYKFNPRDNVKFGAAKEDVEIVFDDCSEIEESTQELEDSFTKTEGMVCSTPIKNLIPSQRDLFEIPRSTSVIHEVISEHSKINTSLKKSALLFETLECRLPDSSQINSNIRKNRLSLARCVEIEEENDLNSLTFKDRQQDDDDFQLISQYARLLGPEVEHQE